MSNEWKGHTPTVKPSTRATNGFFMGTAIPPQLARVRKNQGEMRNGKVKKVDKVRYD